MDINIQKPTESPRGKKKSIDDIQYNVKRKRCEEQSQAMLLCSSFPDDVNQFEDFDIVEDDNVNMKNQLWYNMPIQIESQYTHSSFVEYGKKVFLGVLLTYYQFNIENKPTYIENSAVSVTIDFHIRQNIFKCVGIHGENNKHPILYGDEFYICLSGTNGCNLYVTGILPHLRNIGEPRGRIPMTLTEVPDPYSKFCIIDPNPVKMTQLTGTPVKCFQCISIVHAYTNMLLAVDITSTIRSFNNVDYRPYCCTYRDSLYRITSENFWKFVIHNTEEDSRKRDSDAAH